MFIFYNVIQCHNGAGRRAAEQRHVMNFLVAVNLTDTYFIALFNICILLSKSLILNWRPTLNKPSIVEGTST